jgi:serine/threonine protein kinase
VTAAPHDPPDPRVGSVIQGRYKILAIVASGGMGVVYRGERLQLGRPVAIKFLHPWIATQRSFLERFQVEARAMSRLGHPNCASVIDFGVEDVPFLVMDFVAGRSLRSLIESDRLEPTRVLGFARQILSGVAHAHAQGIIHRDLKPGNIIVSDTPGLVDNDRILDFGLAKLKDGPALTVGMAVGTPSYMAPEQTLEGGVVDARTDIYGVGILLFEMLTGKKPFVSDKLADLMLMQQEKQAPRMSAVASGVSFSDTLEAVVAKALAKAPAHRFSSAAEMAAALEETPEAATIRVAAAAYVAAPKVQPPEPHATAVEGVDKTISDMTIIDTSRHDDVVLLPRLPQPAGTSIWKRLLKPLSRPWRRRQRVMAGTSAGAALVIIFVWALSRGHHKPDAPVAAPPPIAASRPVAMDEISPMTPDSTPGLTDAAQLMRMGLRDQAITVLREVRRDYPRSAYANFLLAVAHFEKLWWSVGLQYAEAAIQADPAYRRSPTLTKLLIHSLMSDGFWERAAAFLTHDLAEVSTPYLEEAAQHDESPRVRARAAQILASLARASARSGGR